MLSKTRDAFNNSTFRLLRNGFAHWSFEWIDTDGGPVSKVKIVD